jgi:hypothetical protein
MHNDHLQEGISASAVTRRLCRHMSPVDCFIYNYSSPILQQSTDKALKSTHDSLLTLRLPDEVTGWECRRKAIHHVMILRIPSRDVVLFRKLNEEACIPN